MSDSGLTRILILVQTDPTLSKKYTETVCTAGLEKVGESEYRWIRLYPIEKRGLPTQCKYEKFQWIKCRLRAPSNTDHRPESHKIYEDTIQLLEKISPGVNRDWAERRQIILNSGLPCYHSKADIIAGAKCNDFSLCLFKPAKIQKFYAVSQPTDFSEEARKIIEGARQNHSLLKPFSDFSEVKFKKIPFRFKCVFCDDGNKKLDLSVLDWEISALFRNLQNKYKDNQSAKELTLAKYQGFVENRDVYFVLGTRNKEHNMLLASPDSNVNPWSIIAVIPFPKSTQGAFAF